MNLTPSNATAEPATEAAPETPQLDHERLHCYAVALEFAGLVPALTQASKHSLRDQLERAAASTCLNLAEGCGRRARRDRLHFFSIAQGLLDKPASRPCPPHRSFGPCVAMECAAAVDILRVLGHLTFADATRAKHKLTRIVQMLIGLRRR